MRGSLKQNKTYCSKLASRVSMEKYVDYMNEIGAPIKSTQGPYEQGIMPKGQGNRSDIHKFSKLLEEGHSIKEVAMEDPSTYVKYHAGLQKMAFFFGMDAASTWRTVDVQLYYGATGVGKTRKALQIADDLEGDWFLLRRDCGKTIWWDGYTGQKTIILDEYHGDWMKYKAILGILDGHPYRCPVKGGHEWARWTTVVITSSTSYHGWYNRNEYSELQRRINTITHMDPLRGVMPDLHVDEVPNPEVGVIVRDLGVPYPTSFPAHDDNYITSADNYAKSMAGIDPEYYDRWTSGNEALMRCDEEIAEILSGMSNHSDDFMAERDEDSGGEGTSLMSYMLY